MAKYLQTEKVNWKVGMWLHQRHMHVQLNVLFAHQVLLAGNWSDPCRTCWQLWLVVQPIMYKKYRSQAAFHSIGKQINCFHNYKYQQLLGNYFLWKKLVNEKMLLQLTSNVLAIWYCTLMMQNVIRLHNVYISPHFKQCPWPWKETKHRSYLGVVRFSIWQQWRTASNVQQLITSLLRTTITFLNAVPKLR